MKEGFIGGPTGGIPEAVFQPNFGKQLFRGASGAQLRGEVQPRSMGIFTLDQAGLAQRRFYGNVTHDGHIGMNIQNKGLYGNEDRHPDIYAGKIAERFLQYIKANGIDIHAIDGSWRPSGDNYKMFIDYLAKVSQKKPLTADDQLDAAKQTWTGRLATKLGYSEVVINGDWNSSTIIKASFTKLHS